MMNKQEMFDTVARHLFAQGKRSVTVKNDTVNVCMYRGPEGTMCAVGCMIPDEMYSDLMEDRTVYSLFVDFPKIKEFFGDDNRHFLRGIQMVHDSVFHWENTDRMKRALLDFAILTGLDPSILSTLKFEDR
jgi:hypothetical protein